jgi:tRNA-specific 2-thiouridylase
MIMLNTKSKKDTTVFVAMSGGVDSSVVAGLMKDEGYNVVGVTMCFNITHPNSTKPSCCGIDGIQDAKRAAEILEIPHYVFNFAKDINDFIIDDFTNEYLNGRTPNPCVRCNQHLKFGSLYDKVKAPAFRPHGSRPTITTLPPPFTIYRRDGRDISHAA